MESTPENIIKFMIEWAEHYFRSKDAFLKQIVSIERSGKGLKISFKDRKEEVLAMPDLTQLREKDMKDSLSLITLNNRKNLDYLYYNWNKFSVFPSLRLYFINPFSSLEKKWIINPHTHSRICDDASLRAGLISIFGTVEPLTIEIFQARI